LKTVRISNVLIALLLVILYANPTFAQTTSSAIPDWAKVDYHLALAEHQPTPSASQPTGVFPPIIPEILTSIDPAGVVETFNLATPTDTSTNAFFQSLGTNGRACATCHEPC
jgi:hypothetical protein